MRLALSAALLAFLATRLDMSAAARAVAAVDRPLLAIVLVLVACDRAVMILRWVLLLRSAGVSLTTREAAHIFLVSSFVGSFLPAGIGADAARAYGVLRATQEGSRAVASVAIDRALGVLALLAMGCVGLALWSPRTFDVPVTLGVVLLVAAAAALLWADVVFSAVLPSGWRETRIATRFSTIAAALGSYRQQRAVVTQVFMWSVFVQLLRITQAALLGAGLGLTVAPSYYLMVMPVAFLMLLLPISVSGFGVPQAVIVWLFRPAGVPDEQSFALSTLIVLTGLAGNLPGLVLWLRQRRGTPEEP